MATSGIKRADRLAGIIIGVTILAFCAVGFAVFASQIHQPPQTRVNARALYYAQHQMQWISGPSLVSSYILPMRELPHALKLYVPKKLAEDVDAKDLIRRFGGSRQIGLVLLHGVFDTLPPGEGVIVHADVIVLVDVRRDRGIFLMD